MDTDNQPGFTGVLPTEDIEAYKEWASGQAPKIYGLTDTPDTEYKKETLSGTFFNFSAWDEMETEFSKLYGRVSALEMALKAPPSPSVTLGDSIIEERGGPPSAGDKPPKKKRVRRRKTAASTPRKKRGRPKKPEGAEKK